MDKNPHLPGTPDEFISKNLGLAHSVAFSFMLNARKNDSIRFDEDDFKSIAYLGLIRAYQLFNPTGFKGENGEPIKFSTYAVPMIRGTLMRHVRDHGRLIRNRGESIPVDSLDRPVEFDEKKTFGDFVLSGSYQIGEEVILTDFLSTVGPRLQRLFELRARGLSQREISKILGVTQVTVSRMERYLLESARQYGLGMNLESRKRFKGPRAS
ncbi:sigma-70 family RNA polymerase sigma factor [Desulfosporosinus hippei]|uniref:RNA polymerase sigma factor, sigma-70 family n=1 Tax=Desulfosporosinus hippei DSM 8344 TaxID=1121419 RepID=A0A1G7UMI1_9FIRM|nr:sigma-70 family RNA polymerase sigma factor [Desulfosporosinus hippei]SDG48568.1 RNA polymerase sigma factor, sigma-70 family [Desulfosporosinus hippei DSM 8344]